MAAATLAGCGVSGESAGSETVPDVLVDPPEGFERFDGDGYALVVPSDWERQEPPTDSDVARGLVGPGPDDEAPVMLVAANDEGNQGYEITAGPGGVGGLTPPDEQRPVTGPRVVRGALITNEIEELVVAYLEADQGGDCDRKYELNADRAEGSSRDEYDCDDEPSDGDSSFEVTRIVGDGDEAAVYFNRTTDDGRVLDQTATVRRIDGEWLWSGFFLS